MNGNRRSAMTSPNLQFPNPTPCVQPHPQPSTGNPDPGILNPPAHSGDHDHRAPRPIGRHHTTINPSPNITFLTEGISSTSSLTVFQSAPGCSSALMIDTNSSQLDCSGRSRLKSRFGPSSATKCAGFAGS